MLSTGIGRLGRVREIVSRRAARYRGGRRLVGGRLAGALLVAVAVAGCSLGGDPVDTASLDPLASPPPPADLSPRPAPTRASSRPDPTPPARPPPRPAPAPAGTPAAAPPPVVTSPEDVAAFCAERAGSEPVLLGLVAAASGGYGGDGRLDPALGGLGERPLPSGGSAASAVPATLAELVGALERLRTGAPPEAAADLDQVLAALADGPPDDVETADLLDAANRLLGSLAAACPGS